MKDIHNHLIVGIDDGSKRYEDSIRILKYMEDMGYTDNGEALESMFVPEDRIKMFLEWKKKH